MLIQFITKMKTLAMFSSKLSWHQFVCMNENFVSAFVYEGPLEDPRIPFNFYDSMPYFIRY